MKKIILSLFLFIVAVAGAPSGASAIGISLSYDLNHYPPNPCVDSCNYDSILSGSIGIYDLMRDGVLIPEPGPPDTPFGERSSGAFVFDAAPGALLYLSFEGAIRLPNPGPPEAPVFAFLNGTVEGDMAVSMAPASAPLLFIGEVGYDGVLIPSPGPPDFPLFSFSSPGVEVGSLTVSMATVPEPSTMLLLGSGLVGLGFVRRRFKG